MKQTTNYPLKRKKRNEGEMGDRVLQSGIYGRSEHQSMGVVGLMPVTQKVQYQGNL